MTILLRFSFCCCCSALTLGTICLFDYNERTTTVTMALIIVAFCATMADVWQKKEELRREKEQKREAAEEV